MSAPKMNVHKFFPAQEPQPEELTTAIEDTCVNLNDRIGTILQPGIVPADKLYAETGDTYWQNAGQFTVSVTGTLQVSVSGGIAFNSKRERIYIAPGASDPFDAGNPALVDSLGNAIPKSTGNAGMSLPDNSTRYIYVRYLHAVDTTTAGGMDPQSGYTVDPDTGVLDYVHYVDGYEIVVLESPSVDADDIYLATVETAEGNTTVTVETTSPARQYAHISSALVKAQVPNGSTVMPTGTYAPGQVTDMSEHVRCVADPALVTATNPHGTDYARGSIPSLDARLSAYSDSPANFQTNGIVAPDTDRPGPLYADTGVAGTVQRISLSLPAPGQYAYVEGREYSNDSFFAAGAQYYSERYISSGDPLTLIDTSGEGVLSVDFPPSNPSLRPTGFYYVCLKNYLVGANLYPAAVAIAAGTDVPSDLYKVLLLDYLSVADKATYLPVAVVYWNGTIFSDLTDPETGLTNDIIDVRHWGLISDRDMAHEKRLYSSAGDPTTDEIQLRHNVRVYKKNLILHGVGAAGSDGGNLDVRAGRVKLDSASTVDCTFANEGALKVRNVADDTDFSYAFIPGEIKMYGGAIAPAGWELCHGQAVSRTGKYSRLFAAISTQYGIGDGSTTFNLPDFRGRMPRGAAGGTVYPTTLGAVGGAEQHTLVTSEIPAHTHPFTIAMGNTNDTGSIAEGQTSNTTSYSSTTDANTGGGQPHNNMPPYLGVNFIIKY